MYGDECSLDFYGNHNIYQYKIIILHTWNNMLIMSQILKCLQAAYLKIEKVYNANSIKPNAI